MSEPKIAKRQPAILELEPGTYYWCACGLSEKQPFCDGSHQGTGFVPKQLEITSRRKIALCQCKHSEQAPLCDGSHQHLAED